MRNVRNHLDCLTSSFRGSEKDIRSIGIIDFGFNVPFRKATMMSFVLWHPEEPRSMRKRLLLMLLAVVVAGCRSNASVIPLLSARVCSGVEREIGHTARGAQGGEAK